MKELIDYCKSYADFREASQQKPVDKSIKSFINYLLKAYPEEPFQQYMFDKWCSKHDTETMNSQYVRVASINAFVRFMNQRGLSDVVPYEHIKWSTQPKRIIYLTKEEINNFFLAINEQPCDSTIQRITAMTWSVLFRLYYSTGLRPIEARLLSTKDVNLETGTLSIVNTKGYNQHMVALHESVINLMRQYNDLISKICPNREFFFVKSDGNKLARSAINAAYQTFWHKYNDRSSVTYHFRHNYAIQNINSWISLGYDQSWNRLICLSKSMGHRKLKDTLYYYSLAPQYANELKKLSEQNLINIIPELPNEEEY
jgi:integrase